MTGAGQAFLPLNVEIKLKEMLAKFGPNSIAMHAWMT